MAEIKLDDEQLNEALKAAILVAIGSAGREQIIKEAISHLTTRERGAYGASQKSPLDQIIHEAARKIASALLSEKLAADPIFIENLGAIYSDALKKLFNVENREKLVERMADVMGRALSER